MVSKFTWDLAKNMCLCRTCTFCINTDMNWQSLSGPLYVSDTYVLYFMQIRPDRQTLYWSATWPKEVEQLARQFLYNPYKVRCFIILVILNHWLLL